MYSLIKAVTVLDEIIQFLSGIVNNILVQLNSMIHAIWPFEGKKGQKTYTQYFI